MLWVAPACGAATGEWLASAELPYIHTLESGDRPRLLIVEQSGVDLRLRHADGSESDSPIGRMGPEFVYVEPGASESIRVEAAHGATGAGRFRLTYLEIGAEVSGAFASALDEAGRDFGAGTVDGAAQACGKYDDLALSPERDSDWPTLARLIAAACALSSGREVAPERLDAVPGEFAFHGVLPYRSSWLRAEHLHAGYAYAQAEGELLLALETARSAMAAFPERALGIRHDIAEIQTVLGGNAALLAYISGEDYSKRQRERLLDASARYLDAAIAEGQALGNAYVLGRAYDYRAAWHFVSDDSAGVIENLSYAKEHIEKTGNREWLLPILGSIGDFYKRWGELRPAQTAYLEALSIVDGDTANGMFADVYDNAGLLYHDLGDYARARSYIEQGIALSLQTGREPRAYASMRNLAEILEDQHDYDGAGELLRDVVEFYARSDVESQSQLWSPYRIASQSALSRIEHKRGNLEVAYALSKEALDQLDSRAINVSIDLRRININHANILFDRGEPQLALALLEESIERYAAEPMQLIDLLGAKMTLLQALDDRDAAIATAQRTFALIESQRAEIDAVRLGAYWSGRNNALYASHVDYLLQAGADQPGLRAMAFEVAERARAMSLRLRRLEMLLARNESNSAARGEWIELVTEATNGADGPVTESERLEREQRLTQARERYFASHGLTVAPGGLDLRSLSDVQQSLENDEILLMFVAAPERVWRFDVAKDGASVALIGATQEMQTLIDGARYELSNRGVSRDRYTSELSQALLADLDARLSGKRLLVSPSSNMSSLPFAALRIGDSYLADTVTVTLVPSVSEYVSSAGRPSADATGQRLQLAVLADPDFGNVLAPQLYPRKDVEVLRSWAETLERLPASGREAVALSQFYDAERRRILVGEDATQRNFFDAGFLSAEIIHIATHGYFDENIPDLVGFATAADGPGDDGFVSLAEISGLAISADLVVISACSTGRGTEVAGEGNMSLARTFLAQGVGSVISTLWPVSDAATARFMEEFYRALNERGQDYAAALKTAQNVLRDSRRFGDPYYWSAYSLTSVAARPH